jgi:GT2 family glycosyltransferase
VEASAGISVVIASLGRKAVLHETVLSILKQTLLPAEIVISVPSLDHVEDRTRELPRVRVVIAPRGSSAQRNHAVRSLPDTCRYVAFFDDDMELDVHWLERMFDMVDSDPDVVLATGVLIADGAGSGGIPREAAKRLVDGDSAGQGKGSAEITDVPGVQANHMFCCRWLADELSFDERLPLYGWLEDLDFSLRARVYGRIVRTSSCRSVHLAHQSGRVSGYRLGYSQIMNPVYIMKKGTGLTPRKVMRVFWLPVLLKNACMFWNRVRRERFVGHLRAISMLLRGRIEPERVVDFG